MMMMGMVTRKLLEEGVLESHYIDYLLTTLTENVCNFVVLFREQANEEMERQQVSCFSFYWISGV